MLSLKAYNRTPILQNKMKFFSFLLLFFFLFIGCQNENKLTFEPHIVETTACENCTKIKINLPHALEESKLARTINTALQEEVISFLHFDDDIEVSDVDTAIDSFKSGFVALQKRYEDETTPWEAEIDSEVAFENPTLLSITIDAYIFTGGAHGYTSKRFLNFDKSKGQEIENWQLFKDSVAFKNLAELKFRTKEKIPLDKPINYTGFMFEQDSFYLPVNIGFTEKGMKLLYNQYEVSSFADGTIELDLPFEEIQKFIKPKVGS